MGFLQPLFLALAAAAAVPILLHLFHRHQGPRVVFPALRYLRRAERDHARRIRLRQMLLMILRVAAILLLAAAAARPFVRAGGAAHTPTGVAIVLDNSMSTGVVSGDVRVLDLLKTRALETLAAADPQDRFWLIRAGSPWEPAWPGDAESTADRVRETVTSAAAADLPAAVEQARALLEAGAEGRATEIHLLTDLQATGLAPRVGAQAPGTVPLLVWAPSEAPPANRAVAAVEIGGGAIPPAGLRTTAAVLVSGAPDSSITIRLALGGRVIGAATPEAGSAAILALPGLPAGLVWGYAETDPDALRADDRRYFAMRVPDPPRVAVVGDLGLAEAALDVVASAGRIQRTALPDADVVLTAGFAGAASVPAAAAVIVLPPGSAAELPGLNRRLAEAGIPWRYESDTTPGETRFVAPAGDPLQTQLAAVRVFQAYPLAPAGDLRAGADSTLLRLDDGTAWAVRGMRRGGGRYVLVASSLSETASTLPASAALVPLVDRLLGSWASAAAAPLGLEPGSAITIPNGIDEVEQPDGTRDAVSAGVTYRIGAGAGVYRLFAADDTVEVLAVNPSARESDLRRADRGEVEAAFSGFEVTVVRDAAWSRSVFRSRLGRDVWRSAALAALLVLFLESFAAVAGARSGSHGTRPTPAPGTRAPAT